MPYIAPLKDMLFGIEHLAQLYQLFKQPGWQDS